MSASARYAFGRFLLLPAQRTLLRDGQAIALGSRAFDLLTVLAENAGEVVSKDELMARVWPRVVVDEGSLRVHVTMLRKALQEEECGERHIANVPRRGYSLVTRVAAGLADAAPAFPPPMIALDAPVAPAPLIGRENAIEHAAQTLLQRRFLTVAGPGGIGKTSVAVAAATRLRAQRQMRICFVDLGAMAANAPVEGAISAAMGSNLPASEAASPAPTVLLLDNCEHVLDPVANLSEQLVLRTPSLMVLATSREPLRARGEWVQRLQPLAQPPLDAPMAYREALGYAAFELFVERAGAAQLRYGDEDVELIGRLCRRLDGNPLAIELAASQAGFFGLAGLLAHLQAVGDLPAAGWRTAQPRHHSMSESLRWSLALLSPGERRMFRQLATLREPFALATAVSLSPEEDGPAAAQSLMGLVRKSLVWADANGPAAARYRMCETTRAFAAAQLA